MKGGWKETRGVQRLISAEVPVSESRMASLNPFETERKKAPSGTSSRVREWFMADRQGFEPWRRSPAYTLSRRAPSTTRPPLHLDQITGNNRKNQALIDFYFFATGNVCLPSCYFCPFSRFYLSLFLLFLQSF